MNLRIHKPLIKLFTQTIRLSGFQQNFKASLQFGNFTIMWTVLSTHNLLSRFYDGVGRVSNYVINEPVKQPQISLCTQSYHEGWYLNDLVATSHKDHVVVEPSDHNEMYFYDIRRP